MACDVSPVAMFLSFIQLFPTPCENPHYHLPDVVRMQKAGAVPALKACGSDAAGADLRLWIHPRLHNYSCILQIFNFAFRCKKRPADRNFYPLVRCVLWKSQDTDGTVGQ